MHFLFVLCRDRMNSKGRGCKTDTLSKYNKDMHCDVSAHSILKTGHVRIRSAHFCNGFRVEVRNRLFGGVSVLIRQLGYTTFPGPKRNRTFQNMFVVIAMS